MRGMVVLVVASLGMQAQVLLGVWGATAPRATHLFNDGIWRGASAAIESRVVLPSAAPLFEVPVQLALSAESVRPSWSGASLLDDYRGWVLRLSLVWLASQHAALTPSLRLGTGLSLGQRYTHASNGDTALTWQPARAMVAFWALGVQGRITSAIDWHAEVECLTGDGLGLLLPFRVGLFYRWDQ
ncbi:MAG: hypothetical protein KatS3mg039_1454 [Candidatus Kapaibacterium sp.]|nr:MAG: hypothetical protein KatS3mg039_1454 [Candidatus Kapabacteria bacterium]